MSVFKHYEHLNAVDGTPGLDNERVQADGASVVSSSAATAPPTTHGLNNNFEMQPQVAPPPPQLPLTTPSTSSQDMEKYGKSGRQYLA